MSWVLLLDAINEPLCHRKHSSLWQPLSQVHNSQRMKDRWGHCVTWLQLGFRCQAPTLTNQPLQLSLEDDVYWSGHTTAIITWPIQDQWCCVASASCNSLSSSTRSTWCFITKRPFRWNTGMSHLYLSNHILFSGRLMSTSWRANCRQADRQTEGKLCFCVTPTPQMRSGRAGWTELMFGRVTTNTSTVIRHFLLLLWYCSCSIQ